MRWFRQSAIGVFGDLFLILPFLPRVLEWVLESRIVRLGLEMANLGQAVDFIIQHLENPGWLGNVWLQVGIVIVGLLLIFWDRKRPNWLPSPELRPRPMIVTGLMIILVGVIAGAVLIGIGLRNQTKASIQTVATQVQAEQPQSAQPLFTTEDIRKMLTALGQMQTIVGTQVRGAYEATQFVSLDILKKEGSSALIAKLQPIRDAMRRANADLNQLFFDYRYYNAELRPVLAGYDSALGWQDGSLTPIIDDLNKYSSGPPDVLEALIRDRFIEWANGRSSHFGKWYGGAEVRIANETKKIREWPRIVDTLPASIPSVSSATRTTPQLLPDDGGPIKWAGGFLLSAAGNQGGMIIGGIQATGQNESDDFLGPISGFVRSEVTGQQIPMLVDSDKGEEVPLDGYGIPARNQFRVFTKFGTQLNATDFLRDFGRMTFVFQYGDHIYKKHFSPEELEQEIQRTETFLAPKPQISKVGVRRMPAGSTPATRP